MVKQQTKNNTQSKSNNNKLTGFLPLEQNNARLLILGSMPGTASLLKHEYYGHPRNSFWSIMAKIFNFETSLPYKQRVSKILQKEIAVWDVLKNCQRPGSLDSNIDKASIVANNFALFFDQHPQINRILFNGSTAATLYKKHVVPILPPRHIQIEQVTLPSTSPAHASKNFDVKLKEWSKIISMIHHSSRS